MKLFSYCRSVFRIAVLLLISAAVPLAAGGNGNTRHRYSEDELRLLTRLTVHILKGQHYRHQTMDAEFSGRLFDTFFDELDPAHIIFTQEDIRRFSPEREHLCARLENGDFRFALLVYELFLRRNAEMREYFDRRLEEPFDFTSDEEIELNRAKLPRPADSAEQRKLWELRLKNDVLNYRLQARITAEAAEKDPEAARRAAKLKSPEERIRRRMRDLDNSIRQREPIEIIGIYLNSLALCFGPHSNYMPPSLDEDFDIQMSLSLSGIGATLTNDDGYVKVVDLVPGGPAALDGRLKVDDRIIAVTQEDGEPLDLIDMSVSKAVKFIRGEVGTKVTLTVLPAENGLSALPTEITLTRAKVKLVEGAAKGEIREAGSDGAVRRVGVITLPGFYCDFEAGRRGDSDAKRCSADVAEILRKFNSEGVDALVMDIRGNGGGSLAEAIAMSGLFFPSGPVVQLKSGNSVELEKDTDGECLWPGKVVILTSKLSASASEIFTAALRDAGRAVVVGDSRTFGKGSVLEVVKLGDMFRYAGDDAEPGSVTFETAMFFRPGGGSVQQLGIASDIVLPSATEEMEIGELFLNYHLPWESVPPVETHPAPEFAEQLQILKERSAARVAASEDFKKLADRAKQFRIRRERNSVSLNEEKRWKEYRDEKELQDAADKLQGTGDKDIIEEKHEDPGLDEAVNIAADFASLR